MGAHLLKQSLRANAMSFNTYSPEGWSPRLRVTVMGGSGGQTAAGAELVWTVKKPDGSDWFEHRADMPELAEEEYKTFELQYWESEGDIKEEGDCQFTIRVVSELDGVDEVLHNGVLTAKKAGEADKHIYALDNSWFEPLAIVALDVYDEKDAPKLRATVFEFGDIGSYLYEAYLFKDGKRLQQSSYLMEGWGFNDNTGSGVVGRELIAEFDECRGWNNIEDWNTHWHRLDQNPGQYEVKFLKEKKVARSVKFDVGDDGRIVVAGPIEPDEAGRPGMLITDKKLSKDAFYGDAETAAVTWSSDGMYWYWAGRTAAEQPAEEGGTELDEETAEELQSVVDKASSLISMWEEDMKKGIDKSEPLSFQSDFITQCEVIVIPDVDSWEAKRNELSDIPDDTKIEVHDGTTTLGEATARVLKLRELAKSHISGEAQAQEDELAPFRAVLKNDKLAIFEDHPANSFRYYTTNKKVIETPEELAKATCWFFDGVAEITGTVEVDGKKVKATVDGYRVLGYKFDKDHNIVEEDEKTGQGHNAPKSAFKL